MLSHSPKIVTDGLVFYYDAANTKKSWIGAPTTNLISNNGQLSLWSKAGGITSVTDNALAPDGSYTASLVTANGTTNSYIGISGTITSGNTYTKSVIARAGTTSNLILESYDNNGSGGTGYYTTTFNLSNGTYSGTGHTASMISLGKGWYKCIATRAYTLTTGGGTFYIGAYGAGTGTLYLWRPMMEQGSTASTYTSTTRTTTQAILDLTKNKTITASSLTYNVDGSFSFNGSSNYITIPQPSIQISPNRWTITGWINPSINQDAFFLTPQSAGVDHFLAITPSASFRYQITESADINNRSYSSPNGSVPAGTWTHFSASMDNLTIKLFLNGIQYINQTETIPIADWTGDWILGQRGNSTFWFNGSLTALKVYNRALSATEVLQNFNALRGRYGI